MKEKSFWRQNSRFQKVNFKTVLWRQNRLNAQVDLKKLVFMLLNGKKLVLF